MVAGNKPVMVSVNAPVLPVRVVLVARAVVGFGEVLQTVPLAITGEPPSLITLLFTLAIAVLITCTVVVLVITGVAAVVTVRVIVVEVAVGVLVQAALEVSTQLTASPFVKAEEV